MNKPWSPVRVPAFWLLLLVNGGVGLVVLVITAVLLFYSPRAGAVAVSMVLAYAALWLIFLLKVIDRIERRPAWLVGAAMGWGATAACAVGVGAGVYLDSVVAKAFSPTFAAQWGAALVAPTAEETAKAAGVVLLLLAARPHLITVWSGAVYGALVGVGFALTEDAAYAIMYADMALPDDVIAAQELLLLRFSTPGVAGHPLFSAVAGAGIGYAWLRADRPPGQRVAVLAGAMGGAWVMHFMVNSPLAAGAARALSGLGWAGGWAGYVLVATLPAVPALYWLATVRRTDSRLLLGRASVLLPGLVAPGEVPVVAGVRARIRADRAVRRSHGRRAVGATRRLRRAQVKLAAALAAPYRGYAAAAPGWLAPPVHRWCREVCEARAEFARLTAAGSPSRNESTTRP